MSDLSIAVLLKFDLLKSQKVGFYLIFQAILTAKSVYSENKQLWMSKENNIRACDRNSSRFQDPLCSSSLVTQTQFYSEQKCAHLINYISKFLAFRRNMWLSSGQKKKKYKQNCCVRLPGGLVQRKLPHLGGAHLALLTFCILDAWDSDHGGYRSTTILDDEVTLRTETT